MQGRPPGRPYEEQQLEGSLWPPAIIGGHGPPYTGHWPKDFHPIWAQAKACGYISSFY